MIASCRFLEKELRQFSREGGVTLADSVETLGVDLRTRAKKLRAKEKVRRKKCKVRFSQKKKLFLKLHESGCQEVVTCGYGAEGVVDRKMVSRAEAWMRQIQEVQTWKQVRGLAGSVLC